MSNGIDFVIGGKDQAKPAMSSVEQSLSRLEAKTNALGVATSGLTKLTGGLVAVWAAMKSALAIIGGIDAINSAYDDAADATSELNVALKLQGVNVDVESARLQSFADEIQKLTGINDDATLSLMRQAALLGTSADQLDDMAQAAIGLAEATGSDTTSAMRMLRQATEGHFDSLNKAIPALRTMTTDEEKMAAVLELSARGFEAKATWSNKVAESGAHASTALDKLMESVGAILAPFRVLISSGIQVFAESVTTLLVPAVEYAEEALANIGPLMDWVKEKVIQGVNLMVGAFTFFEVILTNLASVWEIAVAQSEIWMLQLVGVIEHALTVAIPAYAAWFGENFVNLMRDALNLAYTVVTNHVQKIVDAFVVLWDFIASGGTTDVLGQLGEISGRSWLEGFESSLTDLPTVMGRQITDREKELAERIGQVGANLGDEFSRKMKERMIGVGDGVGDEFDKEINLKLNAAGSAANTAKRNDGTFGTTINATESRLLTRGPGSSVADMIQQILQQVKKLVAKPVMDGDAKANIDAIKKAAQAAAKNKLIAVPVK